MTAVGVNASSGHWIGEQLCYKDYFGFGLGYTLYSILYILSIL